MGFVLMKPIMQLSDDEPQPESERDNTAGERDNSSVLMVVMRPECELRELRDDAESAVRPGSWRASAPGPI